MNRRRLLAGRWHSRDGFRGVIGLSLRGRVARAKAPQLHLMTSPEIKVRNGPF